MSRKTHRRQRQDLSGIILMPPQGPVGGMKLLPLDGPLMLMPPLLGGEPLLVPPLQA